MKSAQEYMRIMTPLEQMEEAEANKLRNIITVGFGQTALSDVLDDNSYLESKCSNVESLISSLDKLNLENETDVILCSDSLSDKDIKELVNYCHSSELLESVPIVLLTDHSNVQTKKNILRMGLDDIFDTSTSSHLFYERIDIIKKTKKRLIENSEDKLILSVANIDIDINIFKRTGDIIISCLMILALSPLFIVVAILIKLESKGPIFYTAKRAGGGYKIFDFYKFRSMAQGSDEELSKVLHLNQYDAGNSDANSVFYKIKGDPRVTKIGAFLRKTSIDELPQLINVLKGDMSLVGNRPLPLYEAQQMTRDNWVSRFNAPAGITGLWQISKRGKAEMSEEERVELDVEYSQNHSFWYDLWILVKTIPVIFQEDDV